MKRMVWPALVAMCLAVPALAHAADGYVIDNVNLRAGPDPSYPLIDQLEAGTEIDVQGCTDGWEWCDVIAYGNRGWIAGNYIQYQYENQQVMLPSYGAEIGIPIVAFSIGTYWDSYYRNRPFYGDRDDWYNHSYEHRPPPPPHEAYSGRFGNADSDGNGGWHGGDGDGGNRRWNRNDGYPPSQGNAHGDQPRSPGPGFAEHGVAPNQSVPRPRQPEQAAEHDDSGYHRGQGFQGSTQPAPGQAYPRPGQPAGQGFAEHGGAPNQSFSRPRQPEQAAEHDDSGYHRGQGYQGSAQPAPGQAYARPEQPAGQGFSGPGQVNSRPPMAAPAQPARPANGPPVPANQQAPTGQPRARDGNRRDEAARQDNGGH